MSTSRRFVELRDLLLRFRDDWAGAQREFRWPVFEQFNWARDYFDVIAAGNETTALRVVDDAGGDRSLSFSEMARRSAQVASFLNSHGLQRGDRLLVMLPNSVPLWETTLAAIRLGAVVIPATTLLERDDLRDRLERGRVKGIVTDAQLAGRFAGLPGAPLRIAVGVRVEGWLDYERSQAASDRFDTAPTRVDDLLLLYFTSGTTARSKLVVHTHASYPIGHLSTMYGLGLRHGDTHLNISSPGWAKHAWSSVFAPWNAGACIVALAGRFEPRAALDALVEHEVTTFCAPPTVWRMLIQEDLARWKVALREINSAGEPLNPEVIEQVRHAWGLTIRDSYGQTETTMMVGNSPGQKVVPGSMGRALPGYRVVLLDGEGLVGDQGVVALPLRPRAVGLTPGYQPEEGGPPPIEGDYYLTGDVASRDREGYFTFIGRADDIFKSSDYRISPFELESALIEHEAVAEAAVVPAPDPLRTATPKAYIAPAPGFAADAATAAAIFDHARRRLSAYKRVRRIEFAELPKTASGKIRRVELRARENELAERGERAAHEFRIEDFPES